MRFTCSNCRKSVRTVRTSLFAGGLRTIDEDSQLRSVRSTHRCRRELEWQRLDLRNRVRPEFKVFTGNDLAIDMVMYGSDYLLGLSTFAPDAFARRDAMWESGDPRFYELNDLLQYLGTLHVS